MMKFVGLSPEGLGTLRALGAIRRLRQFEPRAAEELLRRGYAKRAFGQLHITVIGENAYNKAMARDKPPAPAQR